MKIVAKSSCDLKQLRDRINKGFKYIEIQLLDDFYKNPVASNYLHVLSQKWDIINVHMPLVPDIGDVPLEYITDNKYREVFKGSCELAQKCAEFYKHPINLIVHNRGIDKTIQKMPGFCQEVCNEFKYLLENYPDVIFSIENVTIMRIKNNCVEFRENPFDANVIFAHWLNEELKTNRFRTTLDTCHVLSNERLMNMLTASEETDEAETMNLDWHFARNRPYVSNIHLNNCSAFGLNPKTHSVTFSTEKDMVTLRRILSCYNEYGLNCPLTLEVNEDDVNDAKNAADLKRVLEALIGNQIDD